MNKSGINSSEIAKIVGVSRSTVSRVINNHSRISEETRERVMDAIKKYKYNPNSSAQALAGKKTKTIALFISSNSDESDIGNPLFYFKIVSIVEYAALYGYHVLTNIVHDMHDPATINLIKEVFYQRCVDGGLFIEFANHEPIIEEIIADGFIVGILDHNIPGRNEPHRIVYNYENEKVARKAVKYLVSLNHRKIGIISGDMFKYSGTQRSKGFLAGLKENALDVNDSWIVSCDYSFTGGYKSMKRILETTTDLPTGICCASDNIAFGVIRALNEHGLNVPDDISVIGIDDHMLSSYFQPALTTFRLDFAELLKTMTSDLISVIETGCSSSVRTRYKYELIERHSCKRI